MTSLSYREPPEHLADELEAVRLRLELTLATRATLPCAPRSSPSREEHPR